MKRNTKFVIGLMVAMMTYAGLKTAHVFMHRPHIGMHFPHNKCQGHIMPHYRGHQP